MLHGLINHPVTIGCENADIFFQGLDIINTMDVDPDQFAIALDKYFLIGVQQLSLRVLGTGRRIRQKITDRLY